MAIENVSDTARWVAVYRAMESARPDAIFRDPFADRLAGERGHEILDGLPKGRAMAWPMIVRTAVFDEIILDAVRVRERLRRFSGSSCSSGCEGLNDVGLVSMFRYRASPGSGERRLGVPRYAGTRHGAVRESQVRREPGGAP